MKRKYEYSNVPEGETRQTTITMIVDNGSSWAFSALLSAKQIERMEKYLVKLTCEVQDDE